MRANGLMVLSKRAVTAAVALLLVLVWVGGALEEHCADVQSAGHADCDACHFRHLSVVETYGAPAPSDLDPVADAVASTDPDGEPGMALGSHPTRGPPA